MAISKAQRDYAIGRAKAMLRAKYKTTAYEFPSWEFILELCGFYDDAELTHYMRNSQAFFILNHPNLYCYKIEYEENTKANQEIKEELDREIKKATDHIMLSDAYEMARYLKSLED